MKRKRLLAFFISGLLCFLTQTPMIGVSYAQTPSVSWAGTKPATPSDGDSDTDSNPLTPKSTPADAALTDDVMSRREFPVSTADELIKWLKDHQSSSGTVYLENNITLPRNYSFFYQGTDILTIDTGEFTLTVQGETVLSCFSGIPGINGELQIQGEGSSGPVLKGDNLSLSTGVTVTATGNNRTGGTAVSAKQVFLLDQAEVFAYGTNAVGITCSKIKARQAKIYSEGDNSTALILTPDKEANSYSPGNIDNCTILAKGDRAVSVVAEGYAVEVSVKDSIIEPELAFGENQPKTPALNWNKRIMMASPESGFVLPSTVSVDLQALDLSHSSINVSLQWPLTDLPDFTVPGIYPVTGVVKNSPSPGLVGNPFELTVMIGRELQPVFNSPSPIYNNVTGILSFLYFPKTLPRDADYTGSTNLWHSSDGGETWELENSHFINTVMVSTWQREAEHLLILDSDHDGVMNGISKVWSLTIHQDETFSFGCTQLQPPSNLVLPDLPTISSLEELIAVAEDQDRSVTDFRLDCDIVIDSYIYIQPRKHLFLDAGDHSIIVKEDSWLTLNLTELRGNGTLRPLIKVESGGNLVLGDIYYETINMDNMEIRAEGDNCVALELDSGANLYTQKYPQISAYGTGGVALRSHTTGSFSLPSGLRLYAKGDSSTALETQGDVDVFYTSILAETDTDHSDPLSLPQAIRAPKDARILVSSAIVTPFPEHAVSRNGVFMDFNEDLDTPLKLWQGPAAGMYLSDTPKLASVSRDGTESGMEPIWINCAWDSSNVDFTSPGRYISSVNFSPYFPVTIEKLPSIKNVEVGILAPSTKPDISLTHPLPLFSFGGMPPRYGFTIWCNSPFTEDISTLWCSGNNGETWEKADSLFDVFYDTYSYTITVSGVEPEKSYLFCLESTGQDGSDGILIVPGVSDVREVTVHNTGKVININWSGDRDGGDIEGNTDSETVQPPPQQVNPPKPEESTPNTPATPTETRTPTAEENEPDSEYREAVADQNQPIYKNVDSLPTGSGTASGSISQMESFGISTDVISATRLSLMLQQMGEAPFSKHGITIIFSADALSKLNIQDDDFITVTIDRNDYDTLFYSISVNDVPVSHLPGTKIMFPYELTSEDTLSLEDERKQRISSHDYDQDTAVASFYVDIPGNFLLIKERLIQEPPVSSNFSQPALSWLYLAAGLVAGLFTLAAAGTFFIRKRRT